MYSPPTKKVLFAVPVMLRERRAFPSKGFREKDRVYVHATAAHCNIISHQILEVQ